MHSLKYLPWGTLSGVALLAVFTMKGIDFLLMQSLLYSGSAFLNLLITPAGSTLLFVGGGLALGAFGVLYLERFARRGSIYGPVLWALAFCLFISLWLGSQLRIGGLGLASFSQFQVMGMIVGVFWRGRPYWR